MAFDKDNASIISNVVSGDGVTVTHAVVDGVDTFTAAVDQTWVANTLQPSFDAAALARIDAIEAKLGIGSSSGGSTASSTSNTIDVAASVSTLTADLPVTWKVLTLSGDTAIDRDVVISSGTTVEGALRLVSKTIEKYASAQINSVTATGSSATFVLNTSFEDYQISVVAGSTADNVVFTVTQ